MRELFASDPQRFERFSLRLGDILFDYSKNRITEETMSMLVTLAQQAGVAESIEAMFRGEKINTHRGPGGAACGAAQSLQYAHLRGWAGCDAGGQPGAGTDAALQRNGTLGWVERLQRQG